MSERKYTKDHEWITVDGSVGTIGITEYAQDALGEMVFADLPDVGAEFSQGDEIGALESVKAASEIYAPISGKVVEVNEALQGSPVLINQDPLAGGWLIRMEVRDAAELEQLLSDDDYQKLIAE